MLGASKQAVWLWISPIRRTLKKLPKIFEEAIKEAPRGLHIRWLFQDEGRFGRINDARRCWAPLPSRPVVGQQIVREYVYGVVAACPFDGQLSSLILRYVDACKVSIFLAHVAGEHIWENLRENHFCNDVLLSLQAVSDRLCGGLRALLSQPDLVKSLTCFDWMNTFLP